MVAPGADGVATLDSVAARAGVSRATASRVLTGSPKVSLRAREAVLSAAAELSYVPNPAARSLAGRRSDSVAFVVAESDERLFADPYFAAVLRGVQAVVAERRLQLLFVLVSREEERERLVRYAAQGHLDGALLLSVHGNDPLPARLRDAGVPVVLSGRPYRAGDDIPFADADNRGGARRAARLLLERGCRRIATIAGPADMPAALDRLQGFREELAAAGRPLEAACVAEGDFTVEGGATAVAALLQRCPDVDALFAANDLMALGALRELAAAGRAVPQDVAVVGYDDVPGAALAHPPLTTVRQPMEEMGREMARLLLAALDGRTDERRVVLATELVRRASA